VKDITAILMNFHQYLLCTAKCLSCVNQDRGSDQWEELTELGYSAFVTTILGLPSTSQYGYWNNPDKRIVVCINEGGVYLEGTEVSKGNWQYQEKSSTEFLRFTFVQFENPSSSSEDISGLNFAFGVDDRGRSICAPVLGCKFLLV